MAGAKTYLVNGLITDCGRIVGEGKKVKGWFDVSTLKEPYRIEGKKTMGLELAEQFDWQLPAYEYARLRETGELEPLFGLKEHEPWTLKALRLRSYATCWHASGCESDAQWQLYASGGAGIAILSSMERLQKTVDFAPHVHGLLAQVEYVDFQTHNMLHKPFHTVMRPGFVKRKSFEHEHEVRGIILMDFGVPQLTLDDAFLNWMRANKPRGIEVKANLPELIQAIVISPVAAPYVEELVRIVTKRHGLDHLVRKSTLGGVPVY